MPSWGVTCRALHAPVYEEDVMGITSTGHAFIYKIANEQILTLYDDKLPDNIADTSKTHHIRGDCVRNCARVS